METMLYHRVMSLLFTNRHMYLSRRFIYTSLKVSNSPSLARILGYLEDQKYIAKSSLTSKKTSPLLYKWVGSAEDQSGLFDNQICIDGEYLI